MRENTCVDFEKKYSLFSAGKSRNVEATLETSTEVLKELEIDIIYN